MLEAILLAHEEIKKICEFIEEYTRGSWKRKARI